MSSGPRTSGPRHLAGGAPRHSPQPGSRRPSAPRPAHAARHRAGRVAVPSVVAAAPVAEVELSEVPPSARVKRSRLAIALSVTVAALPILVVDNLPATAETDDLRTAAVAEDTSSSTTEAPSSSTSEDDPTTTTVEVVEETTSTEADEPATTEVDEPATTEAVVAQAPAPPTTAAPAPEPEPTPATEAHAYGDPADPATWDRLAQCESGGNWSLNSGNGYYGGLQFSLATWQDVGGSGYPHEASREEQIKRGQILQARYGWGQWPHCSSKLGYR